MYLQVKLERKLREKNNENRYINKMKKKAKIHKKSQNVPKMTPPYVRQWVHDLKLIHKRPLKGPSI